MRKFKVGNNDCGADIKATEWVEYFKSLYNPPRISSKKKIVVPYIEDENLDNPIHQSESKEVKNANDFF